MWNIKDQGNRLKWSWPFSAIGKWRFHKVPPTLGSAEKRLSYPWPFHNKKQEEGSPILLEGSWPFSLEAKKRSSYRMGRQISVEKRSKWSRRPSTRGRNPTAEPLTGWDGKYQWRRGRSGLEALPQGEGTLLLNPLPDGMANISGEEVKVALPGGEGTLLLNPLPDGTANISGEEVEVIATPFHKGKEPHCWTPHLPTWARVVGPPRPFPCLQLTQFRRLQ